MLQKKTRSLISSITLGSTLEWYELILYIYWAPIISQLFFCSKSDLVELIDALLVFSIGFLARPIGGFIFGLIGDKYGRKKVFVFSIVIMSIPTFCIGFIPLYAEIGYWSGILLAICRIFQNLPAGGELPGAICYLYESAAPRNKKFVTSFSLIGPTLGSIVAIAECTLMKNYMSHEFLINWGWRLSFIFGGLLGLLGLLLRSRLEETPSFIQLKENRLLQKISHASETIWKHKKNVIKGFCFSVLEIVGYVMLAMIPVLYNVKIVSFDYSEHLLIVSIMLFLSFLLMPIFGKLGDKFGSLKMLKWSAAGIIVISYPLYRTLTGAPLPITVITIFIFVVLISVHFSLIPSLIAQLFPTSVRYTGVGLSFNLCDSILVSLVPPVAVFFAHSWGTIAACSIILSIAALISYISFFFIKDD
ncbi:MAG: MFS transporter [Chlamydiae bacterium]|nr:MFS transporter [Chlamydiota bacterium]